MIFFAYKQCSYVEDNSNSLLSVLDQSVLNESSLEFAFFLV